MVSYDNRHASSWLIGESIRETYQGVVCEYRPREGITNIRKLYGVVINYEKAWRAREIDLGSIRGSREESYNVLTCYCYVLTSYCYVLKEKKISVPLQILISKIDSSIIFFMSFGAFLLGFTYL